MVSETKLGAQAPARIKSLLIKELADRWQGLQAFVVVCPVGLDAITTNQLRSALHAKNIKMTVVKNSIARLALAELDLSSAGELLDAPSAVCYGGESVVDVARELVDWSRKVNTLKLRGAFVEGQVFSVQQLQKLATMPNRAELLAQISTLITAPGHSLALALSVSAGRIAGAIESLVKKLQAEEPEPAAEAAPAAAPEESKPQESTQSAEIAEHTATAEPQDTAEKEDAAEPASGSVSQQQAPEDKQ